MPNRTETIGDVVKRRRYKLKTMFKNCGHDIKIIGDPENPAFIVDDHRVLNVYVKNFELIFTDSAFDGETIHIIKITSHNRIEKEFLDDILDIYEHRRCHRIKLSGTDLYLSGYNFKDKDVRNSGNRYPVFSRITEKYYFSEVKAEEVVDIHPDYELQVV
jgi:hypothetical protein